MDLLAAIRDHADALTDPSPHAEPVTDWTAQRNRTTRRVYITTQPGLLAQLAELMPHHRQTADSNDAGSRGIPSSRPPGDFDALACHTYITIGAVRWCWDLHIDLRETVEQNIHALVGAAPTLDSDRQERLAAELRRWHNQAATLTGWREPPLTLIQPCPDCGERSVLKVNTEKRTAFCTGTIKDPHTGKREPCDASWGSGDFDALAAHLRAFDISARADADLARLKARAERQRAEEQRRAVA